MVDTQVPRPCSDGADFWEFDNDYNICMKATLPEANVGHFKLYGPNIKLIEFKKESVTNNKLTSYIAICDGDSGSGHWVTIKEVTTSHTQRPKDDNIRRALVAVVTSAIDPYYEAPDGKIEQGVCGGIVKGTQGKVEAYSATTINTFHKETLGFIKKWALISKTYGPPYMDWSLQNEVIRREIDFPIFAP